MYGFLLRYMNDNTIYQIEVGNAVDNLLCRGLCIRRRHHMDNGVAFSPARRNGEALLHNLRLYQRRVIEIKKLNCGLFMILLICMLRKIAYI